MEIQHLRKLQELDDVNILAPVDNAVSEQQRNHSNVEKNRRRKSGSFKSSAWSDLISVTCSINLLSGGLSEHVNLLSPLWNI